MEAENRNRSAAEKGKTSQLILTLDRPSFTLTIGGATENYDEALAMCDMAHREIEAKLRAAQVRQVLAAPSGAGIAFPPGRRH